MVFTRLCGLAYFHARTQAQKEDIDGGHEMLSRKRDVWDIPPLSWNAVKNNLNIKRLINNTEPFLINSLWPFEQSP